MYHENLKWTRTTVLIWNFLSMKVAVTTTLSATTACLSATLISFLFEKTFDIGIALNGIIAGLVGITACCSVVNPWHAVIIGFISAWVYYGARRLLFRLQIDDPLDAFPLHGKPYTLTPEPWTLTLNPEP